MSLLLKALKKAEEGEQPTSSDAAAEQPVESASVAPEETTAQLEAASPESAPAGDEAIDFDTIVDEPEPAADAEEESKKARKQRVDAARVFGASKAAAAAGAETSGGGGFGKLIFGLLAVGAIGGGGAYVLQAGLIPGVDLQSVSALIGVSQQQQPIVRARVEQAGTQLEIADNLVLLPVPAVDVQAEVDFAAIRLPENQKGALGEEEYVKQIAFLTGFDISKEKARKVEEQKELLLDLELDFDNEVAEGGAGEEGESEEELYETVVSTADASREAKAAIDQITPSDRQLDIVINGGVSDAAEASAPQAEESVKVAQIDVNVSAEGQERVRLLEEARSLYNSGSYLEAEAVYRNVLLMMPTNKDALRGIAQIAVVTGRYQTAVATYLDILGYYPQDPLAIAELSNLRSGGDKDSFYEVEKALKEFLGKIPGADGRLYFSLGNLYSQHNRLHDAQKAYFEAFSRETNNPDYAYNLAVILDHLSKPQLASRYYQEALKLSANSPVGFNRAEVEARIKDLQ